MATIHVLKHLLCLLLLSPAVVRAESIENTTRVLTTTKFEYKLDASNIPQYGSVQTVVDVVDSVMIDKMHQKLSPLEAAELGDAVFEQVSSEIYSQCFAQGDQCVLARSMLTVSHNGQKSERFIEFATLRLVQDFIKDFDTRYVDVTTTYMFPKIMQTAVEFDIHGVDFHLNPDNIEIFRETMLEVYGDALSAKQSDMDLLDVQYIYQKKKGDSLETHLMISGTCRSCTERSFKYILGIVFEDSREEFQSQLKLNAFSKGSSELAGVTEAEYSWPEEPEFLDSLDETLFVEDVADEVTNNKEIPWWIIWIGIGILLITLGMGIFLFSLEDMRPWEVKKNKSNSCKSCDTSDDNSQLSLSTKQEFEEVELDGSNPYEKYNVASPTNSDDGTTYAI
mmetsp:Transcript_30428/g.72977  ORF Transcript_30428/g.72977 Transcript_30428/m.72977 type:complete len:394 (+) Transcript_30428:84-1265(+)